MDTSDKTILRDLAKQYTEVAAQPVQDKRRTLWRRHNSLKKTRPLIYVRAFAWKEMPQAQCLCEDPFAREYEDFFRRHLFWNTFDDDYDGYARQPGVVASFGQVYERWYIEDPQGS